MPAHSLRVNFDFVFVQNKIRHLKFMNKVNELCSEMANKRNVTLFFLK